MLSPSALTAFSSVFDLAARGVVGHEGEEFVIIHLQRISLLASR